MRAVTKPAAQPVQEVFSLDPPPGAAARPFLKWAGGKRQLLPEILKLVPERFGTYFEPFIGGAALFFSLQPRHAVLNDFNERLARTYRGVRSDVESVITLLRSYPHSRAFFEVFRKRSPDGGFDSDLAAWLIYLNRTAYNGLYRVNRANAFNTPFGDYANPTICDAPLLRACSAALKSAEIRTGDFEEAVRGAKRGDFVYFDPPYVPLSEYSDFSRYTSVPFAGTDQVRLRDVALKLKRRGVHVLLSNSSAPIVHELYEKDFELIHVGATRALNCRPGGRGKVVELLIR